MVKKQSKTLDEAVGEYVRRYKRRPPKGFERWYEWAVERNVTLIDGMSVPHLTSVVEIDDGR